jgi:hypothetical protein
MISRSILCFAFMLIPFLGSCSTTPDEPDPSWIEGFVVAPSERLLWDTTLQTLGRLGYPVGAAADSNALMVTTRWKNQLSPFRGRGFRNQAEVTMSFDPETEGWTVVVRVKHMVNMALAQPADPAFAEWEWRDDDEWEAGIILQHILGAFPPPNIFQQRPEPLAPGEEEALKGLGYL